MRLTVGLPVYQGERYLEEALRSLLGQTFEDFTLLVSDNCSTDDTADIVAKFDDDRIQYVRQQRNIGAAANFEYVLATADTPLFMWAAHDDVWAPTFLETTVALLDANPSAIGGMTAVEVIDEEDELVWISRMPGVGDPSLLRRAFAAIESPNVIYGVFRRDALLNIQIRHIYGADRAMVFQLAFRGPIVYSDEVLRTQRFVGYESVEHDGRLVARKATGPDAYLHKPSPGPMCRIMFDQIAGSPLSPREKLRLRAGVCRQGWRTKRNDWLSDSPFRIRRALSEGRFGDAGMLAARHILLHPRGLLNREGRIRPD